jgi:hypothetical protein
MASPCPFVTLYRPPGGRHHRCPGTHSGSAPHCPPPPLTSTLSSPTDSRISAKSAILSSITLLLWLCPGPSPWHPLAERPHHCEDRNLYLVLQVVRKYIVNQGPTSQPSEEGHQGVIFPEVNPPKNSLEGQCVRLLIRSTLKSPII